jgi:hypothetical protein
LNQGLFLQVFDLKTWQNISKNLAKIAEYTLERGKKKLHIHYCMETNGIG